MAHMHEALTQRIKTLEKELETALEEKQQAFQFRWAKGKVTFEEAVLASPTSEAQVLAGRVCSGFSLPCDLDSAGYLPWNRSFHLVDFFLVVFQAICFPVYGIPRVTREDYSIFDRGHLKYLNLVERINCIYCSYGNGLFAYATEIAGRTEQHWCPIKHARFLRSPNLRYGHFVDYGNAVQYREQIEAVRHDFVDLRTLNPNRPDPPNEESSAAAFTEEAV